MRWMLLAPLIACAGDGLDPNAKVPDFGLVDQNPTSARFDTTVSPRDLQEKVSGWYFGHAT